MKEELRYSSMSIKEMFVRHNEHAARIGQPILRKRPTDRVEMAKALAVILTYRQPPPVLVRDVVVEELCRVSHYISDTGARVDAPLRDRPKGFVAVGFAYIEIVRRIKARLTNSRITTDQLMAYASKIRSRQKGFPAAKLPDKRLRSTLKETK